MFTSLFMNILLCLISVHLIIKSKVGLEFDLFTKQMNINKHFPKLSLSIHKHLGSFITLINSCHIRIQASSYTN